ncbi:hypothetical protein ACN20G_28275 (plasmid) [Streptomyces sp. BI20]|uniref:hypothetical protein n=1 Tax=Streptomyces sp. BI20 TaxID=3403460 RepID=UPI003C7545DE
MRTVLAALALTGAALAVAAVPAAADGPGHHNTTGNTGIAPALDVHDVQVCGIAPMVGIAPLSEVYGFTGPCAR